MGLSLARPRGRHAKSDERMQDSEEPMSPESNVGEEFIEGKSYSLGLGERLEMLRALRADLDVDIQAVERTMEIM
jgi:hypothetical protein